MKKKKFNILAFVNIVLNVQVDGSVAANAFSFYSVHLIVQGTMNIAVNRTGNVPLYVKQGDLPTTTLYDFSDTSDNSSIILSVPDAQQGIWFLGFFGLSQSTFSFITNANSILRASS